MLASGQRVIEEIATVGWNPKTSSIDLQVVFK
jgi:hypothetical protein